MAILVIAEHDNQSIKVATLNTVAAATQLFPAERTPDRQPFTLPCLP